MGKDTAKYQMTAAQLRGGVRLHAAKKHQVQLRPHVSTLLEVDDVLFSTDSAVVMPCPLDDEGKPKIVGDEDTELSAQGLGLFFVAFQYAKEHSPQKLLVAGHTDTTGKPAHNLDLSDARGAAVYAVLSGDRNLWADTCDAWHRVDDIQRLLKYHAFRNNFDGLDPGPIDNKMGPKTREALEYFQTMYNEQRKRIGVGGRPELAVDGIMGPNTWGAVFDYYQFDLAHMLGGPSGRAVRRHLLGVGSDATNRPASKGERPSAELQRLQLDEQRKHLNFLDPERPYIGLGESFPIEKSYKDDYRSDTNRRVAFLFFKPEDEPSLPPERPAEGATYSTEECPFYDAASYKRNPIDPGQLFAHQLEFQTVNELGQPVSNADVVLRPLIGGEIEAQSDGSGYCKVEEVPPGLIWVKLPDGESASLHIDGNVMPAVLSARHPEAEEHPIASVIVEMSLSEKERKRHQETQRAFRRADPPESRPVPEGDDRERPNVAPPKSETEEESEETFYAHDNLALVAGDRAEGFDRKTLYNVIDEWVNDDYPVVAERGFILMVLDHQQLHCFDAGGQKANSFELEGDIGERLRGSLGAYAAHATPGDPVFRDMKTKSSIVTLEGYEDEGHIPLETLLPEDDHSDLKDYLDSGEHVHILYHAPANAEQLKKVALQGGAGVLETYGSGDGTHERNKATLRYVADVYRGYLEGYIEEVEAVGGSELAELSKLVSDPNLTDAERAEARAKLRSKVKEEVAELKQLGPPRRIYDFPRPTGCSDQQWKELSDLNNVSDFRAWRAISDKLADIADHHSEGAVFFRVKVSLESPSVGGVGHFDGANAKVESTIDVGTDGLIVKRNIAAVGSATVGSAKEGLPLRGKGTGAAVEGEWNIETGKRKTTFKGKVKGAGVQVATDGNVKATTPHGGSAEYNVHKQQFGQGVEIPVPGDVGSIYVGLHMQGILKESLTAYLRGAPGFFERRHPYDFFDPSLRWGELSGHEQENLKVLGWDNTSWNLRGETPFEDFPDPTKDWFSLTDKQKRAATQLGMDRRDWSKWNLAAEGATLED